MKFSSVHTAVDAFRESKDPAAFKYLYTVLSAKLYYVCLRYLKSEHDAQDALQETFVTAFHKFGSYAGNGSFEGWMRRIAVNHCLGKLRLVQRDFETTADNRNLENVAEEPYYADRDETEAKLLKALHALPPGYRTILNLAVIEDYSHREIGELLQISESTSRSQLTRAKNGIEINTRTVMKENGHNDLDRLLKERLGDGSAGVPEFVWENIEERIYPKKKKRRGFFWWFAGLALLFGSAAAWMATGLHDESPKQLPTGRKTAHMEHTSQPTKEGHSDMPSDSRVAGNSSGLPEAKKTDAVSPDRTSTGNPNTSGTAAPDDAPSRDLPRTPKNHGTKGTHARTQTEPGEKRPQSPQDERSTGTAVTLQAAKAPEGPLSQLHLSAGRRETSPGPLALPPKAAALSANTDTPGGLPVSLPKPPRFSVLAYGGPSFYDMAVIKPYFTTGKLSGLPFDASGFEVGLGGSYRLSDRFSVYALGSFNRKQASQRYSFVISEADYFDLVLNGEQVPLANIADVDLENCFLAKDATATYTIASWGVSLGGTYTFLRFGKWRFDADLRLSVNAASRLRVMETAVVSLTEPAAERFNWFQPGAGLAMQYQLNNRLSVGIAPLFSHRFQDSESFSKKLNELVVPLTVRIGL